MLRALAEYGGLVGMLCVLALALICIYPFVLGYFTPEGMKKPRR